MGVVFKARQIKLRRIVALKMIASGHLASESDVKRFQSEAEAAAYLDHPAIVPVFEVGEQDGLHYFSMGLVEGPSLASRVTEGPLPPREAAVLLKTVAEGGQRACTAFRHQDDLTVHPYRHRGSSKGRSETFQPKVVVAEDGATG
jgi:serine/threonine-protein kinase